jgi:hypothetical protein
MEAEFFHAKGQTDRQTEERIDMTKLIIAFRNFEKAPRNWPQKENLCVCLVCIMDAYHLGQNPDVSVK